MARFIGDGFDGRVDGGALVISGDLAAAVVEVVLKNDLLGQRCQPLLSTVLSPEISGRREAVKA